MTATINGEEKTLDLKEPTVTELLSSEHVKQPEMVSVQLNGRILRRPEFGETRVRDGDAVEFLYFMGGG